MTVSRSIDIEEAVRLALAGHMTVYCPPLPASFATPNILVTMTGGSSDKSNTGRGKVDTFTVVLDARANTEDEALTLLRNAVAILEVEHSTGISHIETNSLYSWGADPVRPDLAMCSATLLARAHRETVTL